MGDFIMRIKINFLFWLVLSAATVLSAFSGCWSGDSTDGDQSPDGDEEAADSDIADGNVPDGDASDGDTTDGDVSDGDMPDGDVTDGDIPDGDVTDGDEDVTDTDPDEEPECDPQTSYACHSGDVYWKDCQGNWTTPMEVCDNCACLTDACQANPQYAYQCDDNDIYWYDCHGVKQEIKEDCLGCGCTDGALSCTVNNQASLDCNDDDVYWKDCNGNWMEQKEECGVNGCEGGECRIFSCSNNVCTDPVTDLEWQETPTGGAMSWDSAITHCQNLNLEGTGWRLPTISELRSLIRGCPYTETGGSCGVTDSCLADSCRDTTCYGCIGGDGPADGCYWPDGMNGTCGWYGSSSLREDDDSDAWFVNFEYACVLNDDITTIGGNARCVRNKQ